MRGRPALLLVLACVIAACSSSADDETGAATAPSISDAGDAALVGVDPPEDCHVMQGGWVLCGSSQEHDDIDRTRGGICTEGRRDGSLRLVPEVVVRSDAMCPSYLEVPPGVSVVFTNGGDDPLEVTVEGAASSSSIAPGASWTFSTDEVGQYVWRSDANEAQSGLLEVKPLDEPPPVSTIVPGAA